MGKADRLYDCDQCGFTYKKRDLKRNRGLLVCKACFDNTKKIKQPNLRQGSIRSDSTTTTAVESPTIFSITAAGGITPSHSIDSQLTVSAQIEGQSSIKFGSHYYMQVVGSGGAIDITASPQIVAGNQGDVLTLEGTSDTNTVKIDDGTGVSLMSGLSCTLKDNIVLTLVYDSSASLWREVSRGETIA